MAVNHRIAHDHAFACASVILDLVRHLMREECHRDAHAAFYEALRACLASYDQQCERQAQRLGRPSKN